MKIMTMNRGPKLIWAAGVVIGGHSSSGWRSLFLLGFFFSGLALGVVNWGFVMAIFFIFRFRIYKSGREVYLIV
jgi:hypothetical protein